MKRDDADTPVPDTELHRALSLVIPPEVAQPFIGPRHHKQRVPPRPTDSLHELTLEQRVRRLGEVLPPKLARELCDDTLQRTDVTDGVDAWLESGVRGLVLRGGFSSGKSLHAGYAASRAKPHGPLAPEVSWHRPRGFISGVLHDYDPKAPRVGTAFVVVDDVGRHQRGTDDLDEALCTLIDTSDARFVITTNMTRDEMRELFKGGALIARLRDCAWPITVPDRVWRKTGGDF